MSTANFSPSIKNGWVFSTLQVFPLYMQCWFFFFNRNITAAVTTYEPFCTNGHNLTLISKLWDFFLFPYSNWTVSSCTVQIYYLFFFLVLRHMVLIVEGLTSDQYLLLSQQLKSMDVCHSKSYRISLYRQTKRKVHANVNLV